MIKGRVRNVDYAQSANGRYHAQEFLAKLDDSQKTKFTKLFERMAETGKIWNKQKFKVLKGADGICEFKSKPHRIMCWLSGSTYYLTHGFTKDDDETPPEEIGRAKRIRREHLSGRH